MGRTRKPMGAELRAMRDARLQTAPVSEAARRESSFLRNVAGAGEDLEWILFNQAWTELGFERVGDWWEQRVLPVLVHLDLRPSVALADRVIAAITADEAALPSAQRRTQREIASIARTSQSRVARSRSESRDSEDDLEVAANPEANIPGLQDALDNKTAAGPDSDLADEASDAVEPLDGDASAADPAPVATGDGAAVTPIDHPGTADLGEVEDLDSSTADGVGAPSAAQPLSGDVSNGAGGDETGLAPSREQPVDGREQHGSGVSPAAPDTDRTGRGGEEPGRDAAPVPAPAEAWCDYLYPHGPHNDDEQGVVHADACPGIPVPNPVALIEAFADQFECLDVDAHGPLMTSAELEALGAALIRVTNVVELLTQWHERTNP